VFRELAGQPGTGVRLTRGRLATRGGDGPPPWAADLPGYALCTPEESAGYAVAFWVELPFADMPRYLDYLTARLGAAGGEIVQRRVTSLTEAADAAPVVVNCTGVGARALAGDSRVRAVKGQHVIVANPGLDTFFYEAALGGTEWAGIFPYGEHAVLGGVQVEDDWDRTPDPAVTEGILARCVAVEPRLAGAEVLAVEAGLRPVRDTPRLEREDLESAVCIHNYGHGGIGVTWSWGSADDVLALMP
jgi:D-amino-acid oxidase